MRARIVIAVAVLIAASAGLIVYLTWPSSAANAIFVAPSGDDNAAGAELSPLRTIKAAIARATDTVVLKAGVYREEIGAISKPITITRYREQEAVISGSTKLRLAASGSVLRGLKFTDSHVALTIDADDVLVERCTFHDNETHLALTDHAVHTSIRDDTFTGNGILAVAKPGSFKDVVDNQFESAVTLAQFSEAAGIPFGTVVVDVYPISPSPLASSASPAPSRPTPPALPALELLADPGFEANPVGWKVFGPNTKLTVVNTARSGGHALKITTTAANAVSTGATSNPIPMRTVSATLYTATCWARATVNIGVYVQVQEYTPEWKRAGDPAPSAKVMLPNPAQWYQISVSYRAAATGNMLPLSVFTNNLTAGSGELYVDDCTLITVPAG